MSEVTIGGNRLGSGNKMKAHLKNFERSTHDIGYLWKSTMAAGTLVPFLNELALPGDTFDISLDADIMTHPTIGPLFGSYKFQVDVFQVPIRLYQAKLHMNMLGIGMDMSKVKLPALNLMGPSITKMEGNDLDNHHTNPSSIFAYLGIRGTGLSQTTPTNSMYRKFHAISYLGYWDIYKQYYANKQEDIGVVVHSAVESDRAIVSAKLDGIEFAGSEVAWPFKLDSVCEVVTSGAEELDPYQIFIMLDDGDPAGVFYNRPLTTIFNKFDISPDGNTVTYYECKYVWPEAKINAVSYDAEVKTDSVKLTTFPLKNIDTMRQTLLGHISDEAYVLNSVSPSPYGLALKKKADDGASSAQRTQEGLAVKTYNSDLFNNWISTEWIDGADGISAVTAVDTSDGKFTIDELNLSKKVYDMLNRIALSGGSYDDWLDAVYTHDRQRSAESPIYLGGMMQSLVFQEVVSVSDTSREPFQDANGDVQTGESLGSLAGRGKLGNNKKGGKIIVKIDEPSYIIGICSLTPKIDFSQGNSWHMSLENMDDFHKPSLDQIGFQDLITDQMAWFDTEKEEVNNVPQFKSAGKQPAWINYMTNVNQTRGNFAIEDNQMFMTLNRKYSYGAINQGIKDLTTYIDPVKFNNIFSDTALDAQNFWVQMAVNITARRKMSAKIIPNL